MRKFFERHAKEGEDLSNSQAMRRGFITLHPKHKDSPSSDDITIHRRNAHSSKQVRKKNHGYGFFFDTGKVVLLVDFMPTGTTINVTAMF